MAPSLSTQPTTSIWLRPSSLVARGVRPAAVTCAVLDQLREGDVLVVWKLDRLSRSLKDLLTLLEKVQQAKAGFQSLTESIDTTTPAGRMMMQIVGSFAEFERAMLRERTQIGLLAARKEGRVGGRRPKLTPRQQQEIVRIRLHRRRPRLRLQAQPFESPFRGAVLRSFSQQKSRYAYCISASSLPGVPKGIRSYPPDYCHFNC